MFKFISMQDKNICIVDSDFIEKIGRGNFITSERLTDLIVDTYEIKKMNVCINLLSYINYMNKCNFDSSEYLLKYVYSKYKSYYDGLEKYLVLL